MRRVLILASAIFLPGIIWAGPIGPGQIVTTVSAGSNVTVSTTGPFQYVISATGGGSGGSGGYAVQPATVTFILPLGVLASTITVSTQTVTGEILLKDGTVITSTHPFDYSSSINAIAVSTSSLQTQINSVAVSTGVLSVSTSSLQTQITGLGTTYLTNSSATATYLNINQGLTQSSATATYLQLSSATATYLNKNQATSGTVTSVTGTPPINSSNGTTPAISLSKTIGQNETFTSSVTIVSSITITNTGLTGNSSIGVLDVYSNNAAVAGGQPLFSVGSNQQMNQFTIVDQQPLSLTRYGADIGGLDVGNATSLDQIFDSNSVQSTINWWNNGEMDLQTATTANGGRNIVLKPNTVSEVVVSSLGVTVSTSVTIIGPVSISSNSVMPGATFYQNGNSIIANPTFTTVNGVTPGLVAGTNITSITGSWPNQTINAATQSSGGGSSSLVVTTGAVSGFTGPPISSPTIAIVFDSATFSGQLTASNTAFIQLNPSSVTLQGLITAGTLGALTTSSAAATYLQNSSATATYLNINQGLTQSSATATYLQLSSASATYLQSSSATVTYQLKGNYLTGNQTITLSGDSSGSGATAITVTAAANQPNIRVIGSAGNSVQISSNAIVPGATFYANTTPSLIAGTNITSITGAWPNQTINASGSGGAGVSSGTIVQTVISSVTVSSTTPTTSFANTGLSVTITPKSATDYVRLFIHGPISSSAGGAVFVTVSRSGVNMMGSNGCAEFDPDATLLGTSFGQGACVIYDTAPVTSATTYTVQVKTASGTGGFGDTNVTSYLIAEEINPSGGSTGAVNTGALGQLAYYASAGTALSGGPNTVVTTSSITVQEPVSLASTTFTNGNGQTTTDGGNSYAIYESTSFVMNYSSAVVAATLQNLPGFGWTLPASSTWTVFCNLMCSGAPGGNQYAFTGPTGASLAMAFIGNAGLNTTFTSNTTIMKTFSSASNTFNTSSSAINLLINGEVYSGNGGVLQLQRQAGTPGDSVTLGPGPYCILTRIQ